jgi:hypothetical protein
MPEFFKGFKGSEILRGYSPNIPSPRKVTNLEYIRLQHFYSMQASDIIWVHVQYLLDAVMFELRSVLPP